MTIKKVLLIGSGPISIGQAGEFDYSGSQAIKALKDEGLQVIVINSNIATVQTEPGFADEVYFYPITAEHVTDVIKKERPDGILLSFGGQYALNCGLVLAESGVFDSWSLEVLGTPLSAIRTTEDRQLFQELLQSLHLPFPRSQAVYSIEAAIASSQDIGFPLIIRSGFALGGLGAALCHTPEELQHHAMLALQSVPQILIEESLQGWKEIEYEVMRDQAGNQLMICNMENLNPMGVHTGDSIVVAPSQTLNNQEYQTLRTVALKIAEVLGIVGECNIQFALHPPTGKFYIIEVNARLSRSSALASKATGYPIAWIAAKLALGKSFAEIKNPLTQTTSAFCEPALDYVVVKVPRWNFDKFPGVYRTLGPEMKSIGESMGIGRTFEEALQKAWRMSNPQSAGLLADNIITSLSFRPQGEILFPSQTSNITDNRELVNSLQHLDDQGLPTILHALWQGATIAEIYNLTHIDPWFLSKLKGLVSVGQQLMIQADTLTPDLLKAAKSHGFSDQQIAQLTGLTALQIRQLRQEQGLVPFIRCMDTLAGEYQAQTNYLYLTYHGFNDEPLVPLPQLIMVLGAGSYEIGSSVEFDWSCVSAVKTLHQEGYQTLVLNCNPETVSTDFDVSDILFFEELSRETICDISQKIPLMGIMLAVGGQQPNSLAMALAEDGLPILGTSPLQIHQAENRQQFSALLDRLQIPQPPWAAFKDLPTALNFCEEVGYPVIVRPSYVLSGTAMAVVDQPETLLHHLAQAVAISPTHPVLITKFMDAALEVDCDGVAYQGKIVCLAISEHLEPGGVHSGDSTLFYPPRHVSATDEAFIRQQASAIVQALAITGPFNIQCLKTRSGWQILECNLRCSRSFPFVSKVQGTNLVSLATQAMLGHLKQPLIWGHPQHQGVKMAHFSFDRLRNSYPVLGIDMHATGEVGCIEQNPDDALNRAFRAVGYPAPTTITCVLLSMTTPLTQPALWLQPLAVLRQLNIRVEQTPQTADYLAGDRAILRLKPALQAIQQKHYDLVIQIHESWRLPDHRSEPFLIRRCATDFSVPLLFQPHQALAYLALIK